MKQQFMEILTTILKDGFTWQETIITVVAIAAVVLIVFILAASITKISIALLHTIHGFFTGISNLMHKVGHSLKTILATKPD